MKANADAPWHYRIWRRHTWVIGGLVSAAVGTFGAVEMVSQYRASTAQVFVIQRAQAGEVTQAVRSALDTVDRHVAAIAALPWATGDWLTIEDRRDEYARLLRLVPAIESVSFTDAGGRERLVVSRKTVDRVECCLDQAASRPSGDAPRSLRSFGRVDFVNGYEPLLTLSLKFPESPAAGTTVVTLGLRALGRELGGALDTPGAEVYVVDREDHVILHKDPVVVLAQRRITGEAPREIDGDAELVTSGLHGDLVLRSVAPIEPIGWRAVVEQPRAAAMRSVWATLWRSALTVLASLVAAIAASMYLAGRLTRPIRSLHVAAGRLAAGRLDTRVDVHSQDELQDVAAQFNRMAQSLQGAHENLERKVAEKTQDLERANRHKSEFLANMSHELRTPLNAVIGMSEALLDEGDYGVLNDKQREYLHDINNSGEHLLALINDILDLAKIEAGRVELQVEPFDVPAVAADAIALLRERAQREGVGLNMELDPAVGTWVADPRRFKQVLLNLLTNAVKFTPPGGRVTVRAGLAQAALWVEVEDTGSGIAAEHQQFVFGKFNRIAHAGRPAEGTGLGLSVVQELVRLHGGEVSLQSTLGVGSRFRFTLPRQSP